jgi:VIT1/CCC1 family predicted Fe2+/Mn2+ transporter
MVGDILNFVEQVGIPITAALTVGWFLFIILKFLLAQVTDRISGIAGALLSLENQIDVMNNDIVKIDAQFSCAFGCEPNINRIAASEGKEDCRDD